MKVLVVFGAVVAFFATVANSLAIGFEVDTPLDPFLGGLSKMKRNLVRRLKNLNADDILANPFADNRNSLLYGPQSVSLPPILFADFLPQLTSKAPLTTQMPFSPLDQNRLGQIPQTPSQATDYINLNQVPNQQQLAKSGTPPYQNLFGLRQPEGFIQPFTQTSMPIHCAAHFSNQQQHRFT